MLMFFILQKSITMGPALTWKSRIFRFFIILMVSHHLLVNLFKLMTIKIEKGTSKRDKQTGKQRKGQTEK
jgi:hypothetical protein